MSNVGFQGLGFGHILSLNVRPRPVFCGYEGLSTVRVHMLSNTPVILQLLFES